ncbi:MAG TPA: hypothetical protein PLV68_18370, partial [Ilumatobacteraceae bacterium]|nr:hypothetical protein [Ilumatobacteraceae bacterium]
MLSSFRRVKKGPGHRPQSAKRRRFMQLRERGLSIDAATREVGASRTAGRNWANGKPPRQHRAVFDRHRQRRAETGIAGKLKGHEALTACLPGIYARTMNARGQPTCWRLGEPLNGTQSASRVGGSGTSYKVIQPDRLGKGS